MGGVGGQYAVGNNGPPFRAPCNGWRSQQTGPCFQHTKNSEKNLPEWKNITTVPDWRPTTDRLYQPKGIPPYPRKSDGGATHDQSGTCFDTGGVDPMWPADGGSGDCPGPCGSPCNAQATGQQLCNGWFQAGSSIPSPWNPCHANDSTHFGQDFNCYTSTGGTVDHSKCRKIGFKNVQARKNWHGSWAFNSHERGISWRPGVPSNSCPFCECDYEPMRPVPDQTKYRTMTVTASSFNSINGVVTASANCVRTVTVDRYSGIATLTTCSDVASDPNTLSALQAFLGSNNVHSCSQQQGIVFSPWIFTNELLAQYARAITILFETGGAYASGNATATITGCEPSYSCEAHDSGGGGTLATFSVDISGGTMTFKEYALPNILLTNETIIIGTTTTTWTCDSYSTDGTQHNQISINATLGDPYTAQDVYNDCRDLLKLWQLDDDATYPWRVDEYVSIAPLVSYDEDPAKEPNANIPTCPGPIPYVISGGGRTGNILGSPLQHPGAGPHFDWSHRTWRACNSGGGNDQHYIYAHGAWAHNAPPSPIPAYALDPVTLRDIKSYTETSGVITVVTASATTIADADLCVVCGGFTFDGAYYVERVDDTHFKLHTQNDGFGHYRIILDVDSPPVPAACGTGVIAKATLNSDATFYYAGDETDLAVPTTATQWTENFETGPVTAGQIPAGGSMIYKQGTLYMQKWAEIKVPRPSMNFARPYGLDRYQINHQLVKCVQSLDNSNPQAPILTVLDTLGLANSDHVICCGLGIDGIYTAHLNDSTHIRLDNFQPLSALYTADPDICSTGIVAKLTYQNCPILGHPVSVSKATNATPIVVTLVEKTYLVTGDTVTIAGVLGNTAANGTFKITANSPTEFQLVGSSGNGDYTSGGTVTTSGTAVLGWDDNQPKGEFAYAFFNYNYRDYMEADRVCNQYHNTCNTCSPAAPPVGVNCVQVNGNWQSDVRLNQYNHGLDRSIDLFKIYQDCLSFDKCEPQVMAVLEENATETFTGKPNHKIYMLPYGASLDPDGDTVSFFPDERYGAYWQAFFIQHVVDPFWEQPPPPCFDDTFTGNKIPSLCAFSMDDGSCENDTCLDNTSGTLYYAHEPLVENRLTVPSGAPPLPTGIHIGYLSWSQLQVAGTLNGNLLIPPVGTGYAPEVGGVDPAIPIPAATPWGLAIRSWECVCSSGQFAAEYTANLAKYNC